jgi:hypothetical protein
MRTAKMDNHFVVFDKERHAVYGIVGEVAELVADFQDHCLHETVKDELGDVCWYMALLLHHHNLNFDNYATGEDKKMIANSPGANWGEDGWVIMKMVRHAGAILERIKKRDAYGKEMCWDDISKHFIWLHSCIVRLASNHSIPCTEIMGANIAKLRARFPEKFSEERAINRDREEESRAVSES